jgi:hypothetical protein
MYDAAACTPVGTAESSGITSVAVSSSVRTKRDIRQLWYDRSRAWGEFIVVGKFNDVRRRMKGTSQQAERLP